MSGKGLVYYILGAIALVGAAYFFFRWLDLKFLLPLLLAIAAVILFWKGSAASKNK
jgi:O-antigen ligase